MILDYIFYSIYIIQKHIPPAWKPAEYAKMTLTMMLFTPIVPIMDAILEMNGLLLSTSTFTNIVLFAVTYLPIMYIIEKRYDDDKRIDYIKKKPLGMRIVAMIFTIIAIAITFLSWILDWLTPAREHLVSLFNMNNM